MSFVTVKFGDNKHALFNPNCSAINLLDNIKRRCDCPVGTVIDLSDEDGVIQKLSEKYYQNAGVTLKGGEQYILLRVEKVADRPSIYTPLLNGLEHTNRDLLEKLQNVSKPVDDEMPKQNSSPRKKSPWERANVRKITARARESLNSTPRQHRKDK